MFTIAFQGRKDEARRYRAANSALIAAEESRGGDLNSNLRIVRDNKGLYDKAKGVITGRDRNVPESWWTEHRASLNSAQLIYGLLVPEGA